MKIRFVLNLIFCLSFTTALFAEECSCKKGYANLVEPLLPAVVNIITVQKQTPEQLNISPFPHGLPFEEYNHFFERFGITPPGGTFDDEGDELKDRVKPTAAGSGFIIDKSGYIVTNHHVVAGAEKITVTLIDDKKYDAKLIGSDSRTDLALIKIDTKSDLPIVKFGNSDDIRVGDEIITIGNPFGLGGTVTTGIISARSRDIQSGEGSLVDNFLQTDAAINKGNSGGPMFNLNGEVIGINTAIYSPSGGNVGIGFAVPSSLAEPIIKQIKKDGKVVRAWLGVTIQSTENLADSLGIKENKGALVQSVAKGSPAEKAGISVGDIILKFNGTEVTSSTKLPRLAAEAPINKTIDIEIMSKGKLKIVSLKLTAFEDKLSDISDGSNSSLAEKNPDKSSFQGITVVSVTPELRDKFRLPTNLQGVIIQDIKRKSAGARSGLKIGDLIVAINQQQVENPQKFIKLLELAKSSNKNSVMLWINRIDTNIFLQLPINNAVSQK